VAQHGGGLAANQVDQQALLIGVGTTAQPLGERRRCAVVGAAAVRMVVGQLADLGEFVEEGGGPG
jgi:hypothetical protein